MVYLPNPKSSQMDVIIVWLIPFIPSGMIEIIILGIELKQGIFYISSDATENNAVVERCTV